MSHFLDCDYHVSGQDPPVLLSPLETGGSDASTQADVGVSVVLAKAWGEPAGPLSVANYH